MIRGPIDGNVRSAGCRDTEWYRRYVSDPALCDKKIHSKFRRRFRCSYESFTKHVEEIKSSDLFDVWSEDKVDAVGVPSSPIELLVLGVLRYLGRGWCFDDLEEQTCISETTHRSFLHVYLLWASTTMFEKYVTLPSDGKVAQEWAIEYLLAGFAGCMGSMDATHVGMLKCFYKLKQFNDSWKLNMPSRTYNATVTHRRRIIHTTKGHPGRWNDQTLQLYDALAKCLRDGSKFDDLEFVLLRRLDDGTVVEDRYRGGWLLVDNGYLPWPAMVPPSKLPMTFAELRFSKWVESLRKDVECTFGIMKGRFRVLKTGIPLHGIEVCDRVWLTCCALHNFLLEEDGLDERWDAAKYLYSDGAHDERDVHHYLGARDHRQMLQGMYDFDNSGMGAGEEDGDTPLESVTEEVYEGDMMDVGDGDLMDTEEDNVILVRHMKLADFKSRLIENFDILWRRNEVVWPSRTGTDPPPPVMDM